MTIDEITEKANEKIHKDFPLLKNVLHPVYVQAVIDVLAEAACNKGAEATVNPPVLGKAMHGMANPVSPASAPY